MNLIYYKRKLLDSDSIYFVKQKCKPQVTSNLKVYTDSLYISIKYGCVQLISSTRKGVYIPEQFFEMQKLSNYFASDHKDSFRECIRDFIEWNPCSLLFTNSKPCTHCMQTTRALAKSFHIIP